MSTEGKLNECICPSLYDYLNYLVSKTGASRGEKCRRRIRDRVRKRERVEREEGKRGSTEIR
jgi:hypothetical protein